MNVYVIDPSNRGANVRGVNGKHSPRLEPTKRKKRALDKRDGLELRYLSTIDKRDARKREKLAKREAKRTARG